MNRVCELKHTHYFGTKVSFFIVAKRLNASQVFAGIQTAEEPSEADII